MQKVKNDCTMGTTGFKLNSFYDVDHEPADTCGPLRPHCHTQEEECVRVSDKKRSKHNLKKKDTKICFLPLLLLCLNEKL